MECDAGLQFKFSNWSGGTGNPLEYTYGGLAAFRILVLNETIQYAIIAVSGSVSKAFQW